MENKTTKNENKAKKVVNNNKNMERKILVKNKDYTKTYKDEKYKEKERVLYFKEKGEEIIFTGEDRFKEENIKEKVRLNLKTDKLIIENCKTNDLVARLDSYEEKNKDIKVELKNVKVKFFTLETSRKEKELEVKGENIKNLNALTNIRDLVLSGFENVYIQYRNRNKIVGNITCKNGKSLELRSYGKKRIKVEKIELSDIEKVNVVGLELKSFDRILIKDVKELNVNIRIIKKLKEGDFISCETLIFPHPIRSAKNLELFIEKYKQNLVKTSNVMFNYYSDEDKEESKISLEKLVNKTLSLNEILKIRNIETRRMILKYLGGIRKLLEKEENKVLIEKTDRGELWAVGNVKNFRECIKFLKYKDTSTDREYISFVPPEIRSVRQGFAWKFQIREEEYDKILSES